LCFGYFGIIFGFSSFIRLDETTKPTQQSSGVTKQHNNKQQQQSKETTLYTTIKRVGSFLSFSLTTGKLRLILSLLLFVIVATLRRRIQNQTIGFRIRLQTNKQQELPPRITRTTTYTTIKRVGVESFLVLFYRQVETDVRFLLVVAPLTKKTPLQLQRVQHNNKQTNPKHRDQLLKRSSNSHRQAGHRLSNLLYDSPFSIIVCLVYFVVARVLPQFFFV